MSLLLVTEGLGETVLVLNAELCGIHVRLVSEGLTAAQVQQLMGMSVKGNIAAELKVSQDKSIKTNEVITGIEVVW